MDKSVFARDVIFDQLNDLIELSKTKGREFKCRLKDLPSLRKDFNQIQSEIERLSIKSKSFNKEEQLKIRKSFSDKFYAIQMVADEIYEAEPRLTRGITIDHCCSSNNIKLPSLSLPTFSGDVTNWLSFFDLFTSLVHTNTNLSEIEKFRYLLLSLRGEPLNLVKAIPVTSENYPGAIEILTTRYSNTRVIASKHLDKILDIEPLTSRNQTLRNILNTYYENVTALKMMKFPMEEWSFLLLHILLRKIGPSVRRRFELTLEQPSEIPNVSELIEFLQKELSADEVMQVDAEKRFDRSQATSSKSRVNITHRMSAPNICATTSKPEVKSKCASCDSSAHIVSRCPEFLKLTPQARFDLIKQKNACINCLNLGHAQASCNSHYNCKTCSKRHHSLLHFPQSSTSPPTQSNACALPEPTAGSTLATLTTLTGSSSVAAAAPGTPAKSDGIVLLWTALVDVHANNTTTTVRCLIDSGSQTALMTESCAQRLGLHRRSVRAPLLAIEGLETKPKGQVSFCVSPQNKAEPKFHVNALLLRKITGNLPNYDLTKSWPHIQNLDLADPTYHTGRPVDLLLGGDSIPYMKIGNQVNGPPGSPSAFSSIFGYILTGYVDLRRTTPIYSCLGSFEREMDLQRFWEIEEVGTIAPVSSEHALCESIFVETHTRDRTGRFVVRLPFKAEAASLGDSRSVAQSRLHQLEQRLLRNPKLKLAYDKCLQEYLDLRHMELIRDPADCSITPYYIPHHCVLKESSTTSPLRVVFDASCKSMSGFSLNDMLLVGPKLQQDIVSVILKFRIHNVVFTADIKQMYRQVLVHPEHRDFQRILWRTRLDEPVREFRLRTVTFGVSSAPYLAIRSLRQLALDESNRWPRAAHVLTHDIFVDDVITGAQSIREALSLKTDLIDLCAAGCFELRKWTSNHPELISSDSPVLRSKPHDDPTTPPIHGERGESPPGDSQGERNVVFSDLDGDSSVKVLGLEWSPTLDDFTYKVKPLQNKCTKRAILSEIARIYDPLGWLAPVILYAKNLIQRLWLCGCGWDDVPSDDIVRAWKTFTSELPCLSNIRLPRHIIPFQSSIHLLGFADASETAYAAVLYIRVTDSVGNIHVSLLVAKTRVVPLKRVSIPRLELSGALLLAKLVEKVREIYKNIIQFDNILCWTDSTVVLAWLTSPPHKWKTFVANRVTEVQSRIASSQWRHVSSTDNPADVASRGALPSEFVQHPLWLTGPTWLRNPPHTWPNHNIESICTTEEEKRTNILIATLPTENELDIFSKYSSLGKLLRISSYLLRFVYGKSRGFHGKTVTVAELQSTLTSLINIAQQSEFGKDIECIQEGKPCSTRLQRLKPFIDNEGILRVGGRIHGSSLSYDAKHQIILPKCHQLTILMIDDAHKTYLNPGPQTLQYLLQQRYWILSARDNIRQRTHRCVRCFRCRPTKLQPEMASLPAVRLNQIRPFLKVGVDFAGPFLTRANKVRNAKVVKSYLCIYICMATRAVHLELVCDLSAEAFIASLRRFCSRRGFPTDIYSDNGRNFVSADKRLKELFSFLRDEQVVKNISDYTIPSGISWHFNPAYGSHFGGLWEAGVKSTKHHLVRVIGCQILTYDEFNTLLCQVEAMLNSRPLCIASTDPSDPLPLTPAHFLVGGPLVSLPDANYIDQIPNRLTRWQLVQQCAQHFWHRWSIEYLHGLQQRGKWFRTDQKVPLTEGTVVLVQDDNLPPLQWRLGIVQDTHPGSDGVVRVVTLRLGNNIVKRPAVKVCPLPIQ